MRLHTLWANGNTLHVDVVNDKIWPIRPLHLLKVFLTLTVVRSHGTS